MKKILTNFTTLLMDSFEAIAIARTREALNHLPDHELQILGISRQQLKSGNFYKLNQILDLPTKNNSLKVKMVELENKKAA